MRWRFANVSQLLHAWRTGRLFRLFGIVNAGCQLSGNNGVIAA
jgi:hypothetical protein